MATPAYEPYGLQLLFDGYEADTATLSDVGLLYTFLLEFPAQIGMTRIGFPHVIYIDEPGIVGLSGFVFIMESHIAVHTYAERGFVTMDVYSCKKFNTEKVSEHIRTTFGIKTYEEKIIVRGERFENFPVNSA